MFSKLFSWLKKERLEEWAKKTLPDGSRKNAR